jgi:hypothetical protein
MSTITETNHIERVVLAFRGDVDGSFKGAHLERFNIIKRDGVEIVRQPGRATTISEAAAAGFTWPEVAAEINTGLLLTCESQAAQIVTLTAEKAAAETARIAAETARDTALAEVEALTAQLAEYQTPVDANGVPKQVTMRQAQLALLAAGLLDDVEAAIAAIPGDAGRAAQITWTKSSAVQRDNALIGQLAGALGLTSAEVDALFIQAAKL